MPTYEEIAALAAERAATEIDVWVPEKEGDRIVGKVVENGTITTIYGPSFTSTLAVIGEYVEEGQTKKCPEGIYIRVAWMGAVLDAQYRRMRPDDDDIVAFHYQKDVMPKSGKNAYKLIMATVLNAETGRAKNPVDLSVAPVTEEMDVDERTGEITTPEPGSHRPNPLEPRPGEEPL